MKNAIRMNDPIISRWIRENTHCLNVGVEFGAGRFNYTQAMQTSKRYAIEIHEPYHEDFVGVRVEKVLGDMREYRELKQLPMFDVALFVDSLEHIDKDDGLKLLRQLQEDCRRILIYVPEGQWEEYDKLDPAFHGWGYSNEWQRHRSSWWPEDLLLLGFNVVRWIDDCRLPTMFARWDKYVDLDPYFKRHKEVRGPNAVWG